MSENNKPKTMAEKVLSRTSGKDAMSGGYVWAKPDLLYLHDLMGPVTVSTLEKIGVEKIKYSGKVVFVTDHIYPPKDLASANNIQKIKRYAEQNNIEFIKGGEGIEHTLLVERKYAKPGQLAIGSDSHTVTLGAIGCMGVGMGTTDIAATMALGENWFLVPDSMKIQLSGKPRKFVSGKDIILKVLSNIGGDGANYKSMEFVGESLKHISIDQRLAICNMTVEGGAKSGMVEPDEKIQRYFDMGYDELDSVRADDNANYSEIVDLNLDSLPPQIAAPFSPANVHDVSKYTGTIVDQVYIGNCANGTITDLREAAEVLRNRTVNENVKAIVVPATRRIYQQALSEGLIDIFLKAGVVVAPSTCGACAGLHMGVIGDGETAICNTNRNFRGRMGGMDSRVFLSNSYVAAAAALEGKIIDPEESL